MTEKSLEIGPIVASTMIAIGFATVVWAVATNPRTGEPDKPKFEFHAGNTDTSSAAAVDDNAVSDSEWEATLLGVEKLKTDGTVTKVDPEKQIATVSADRWNALTDDQRRESGRHLAIYCGRISGTDRYQVDIQDESGAKLGSYERN